jgi:hypothetical protein
MLYVGSFLGTYICCIGLGYCELFGRMMKRENMDLPDGVLDVEEKLQNAPDDATHLVQLDIYLKVDDNHLQDVLETIYSKLLEIDEIIASGIR